MATGVQLKSGSNNIYPLCYFPIGAIYMSTSDVSPASLYGGEWLPIEDRFLVGAGATYDLGAIGGEPEVTLTTATIPLHTHTATTGYGPFGSGSRMQGQRGTGNGLGTVVIGSTGSSKAHNNMPRYLAVYTWRRTA